MIIPKWFLNKCASKRYNEMCLALQEPFQNQDKTQALLLASVYADEDDLACDYLVQEYQQCSDINELMDIGIACDMPLRVMLIFAKEHLSQESYDKIFREYEKKHNEAWSMPDQVELYDGNSCSETVMDQDGNKVYYDSDDDEWILDAPGLRTAVLVKRWRLLPCSP